MASPRVDQLRDTESLFRRIVAEVEQHRAHLAQVAKPASPKFNDYAKAFLTLTSKSDFKERTQKNYTAKLQAWQACIGRAQPPAARFTMQQPDQAWKTDIAYICTYEG